MSSDVLRLKEIGDFTNSFIYIEPHKYKINFYIKGKAANFLKLLLCASLK